MSIEQNVLDTIVKHQRTEGQNKAIINLLNSLPAHVQISVEKGRFGDYENIQHTGIVARLNGDSWCVTRTRDDKMWFGVDSYDARIVRYLKRGVSLPNAEEAADIVTNYEGNDILNEWKDNRELLAENLPRLRTMHKLELYLYSCEGTCDDYDYCRPTFSHMTRPNLP